MVDSSSFFFVILNSTFKKPKICRKVTQKFGSAGNIPIQKN